MIKVMLVLILLSFSSVEIQADPAKVSGIDEWQPNEMNPNMDKTIEVDIDGKTPTCTKQPCKFDLRYFTGDGFDPNDPERKYILYIPGGPGQIVDSKDRPLSFLEERYNVVYFDVRGTGNSLVPKSNEYDRFLRAAYVVEDIERIRHALNIKTWAAIYAHSWGTIVGQLYAEKSNKFSESQTGDKLVAKMIFSAPVSRGEKVTENDRAKMILANLQDIYVKYSSPHSSCLGKLKKLEATLTAPFTTGSLVDPTLAKERFKQLKLGTREGTDDFCFMTSEIIAKIAGKLSNILQGLDDYGSLNLVTVYYDNLIRDPKFKRRFPYRRSFYVALRKLQFLGAAEQPSVSVDDEMRQQKTAAALYLGYYLTLPDMALRDQDHPLYPFGGKERGCRVNERVNAQIFEKLDAYWMQRICARINNDEREGLGDFRQQSVSVRGYTVFGVYDGLNRWLFETFDKNKRLDKTGRCFTGKDFGDLVNGKLGTDENVNIETNRIGMDAAEIICAWAPSEHVHSVPTLILKGGADAIIAGGQAEEVFQKGLTGERTLLEFPGVGHQMSLPDITIDGEKITAGDALREIITSFLSVSNERNFGARIIDKEVDPTLYKILGTFTVEVQTAGPG